MAKVNVPVSRNNLKKSKSHGTFRFKRKPNSKYVKSGIINTK